VKRRQRCADIVEEYRCRRFTAIGSRFRLPPQAEAG
jgi:hypothetical protein